LWSIIAFDKEKCDDVDDGLSRIFSFLINQINDNKIFQVIIMRKISGIRYLEFLYD
jgi:hypothetical protein